MSDRDESDDESSAPSSKDEDKQEVEETKGDDSPASTKEKPKATSASKAGRSSKAGGKSRPREQRAIAAAKAPATMATALAITLAVAGVAAGAAAGWFGHIRQAKAKLQAESAPATSGSGAKAGSCGAWEKKICASSGGDDSATCQQAKGAADLLTPSTCDVALEAVPATLVKMKAARAACDQLVTKLCADLPPGSATCQMVKDRTPTFPHQRCTEMLQSYDTVLMEIKTIDQQNSMQMGAGQHGMPPGGMPPGAMPGGMPPGAMPPGDPGAPQP